MVSRRPSVTDGMKSVQQKLRSGVDRKLIRFEDAGCRWVVRPGSKGHNNYIFHIRDRLKADGFLFDGVNWAWYKYKLLAPDSDGAYCAIGPEKDE